MDKKFGLLHILGTMALMAAIVAFLFLRYVVQDHVKPSQFPGKFTHEQIERALKDKHVLERGHLIYSTQCSNCHGSRGQGLGAAPNLASISSGSEVGHFYDLVSSGNEAKGMPAWKKMIQPDDILAVSVYVKQVLEPASRSF